MNANDTKIFILGLTSAFLAALVWDYIKKKTKTYEFEE